MGKGDYCIVCRNNKVNCDSSIHSLHKFPNSPRRKEKWRTVLQLTDSRIPTRAKVCSSHFKKDQFVRNLLIKGAVPSFIKPKPNREPFVDLSNLKLTTIAPKLSSDQWNALQAGSRCVYIPVPVPFPQTDDTKSRGDYQNLPTQASAQLRQTLRVNCKRRIRRMKKRLKTYKAELTKRVSIETVFSKNPAFQKLIETQVQRYQKKRGPYDNFERNMALALYYCSGKHGYRTLLDIGFQLPKIGTILSWLSGFKVETGINQQIMETISRLTSNFSEIDRDCILAWDEMSIKELVEYNKYTDSFDGIIDYDNFGVELESANEVLVFMVQGINSFWRFPLSYYFSKNATTSEMLKNVVSENIEALSFIRLNVRLGICDMSFTNQGLYKLWNISKDKPYNFFDEKKIYFVHDVPHLFKLIRNNLLNHEFIISKAIGHRVVKERVRWSHISTFYNKDKRTCSRLAPKLTNAHIYLRDYSKMKVKLAIQILSSSVYCGMMTMIRLKILKKEAECTAKFLRIIDEMFDFLNMSKLKNDKYGRCAAHFYTNFYKFDKYLEFLSSINIPTYCREPEFLKGLILTVSGLKELTAELRLEGYTHVFTRRLQQDCLENFFSAVRMRGGFSRNATAKQFRLNFRYLFLSSLIFAPDSQNSELCRDFLSRVEKVSSLPIRFTRVRNKLSRIDNDANFLDVKESSDFYLIKGKRKLKLGDEQEAEVAKYLAAASIHAIVKSKRCLECTKLMTSRSKGCNSIFVDFKQFSRVSNHLAYLTTETAKTFIFINKMFPSFVLSTLCKKGNSTMEALVKRYMSESCVKSWIEESCTVHRLIILEYFLRAKLFRLVKDRNENIKRIKSWQQTRRELRNQ